MEDPVVISGGKKVAFTQEQLELVSGVLGDLASYRHIVSGKKRFAEEIVPNFKIDEFQKFHGLFEDILQLFDSAA